MPSSSLFLRSCTTLVSVLSLFSVSAVAAPGDGFTYALQKQYSGNTFLEGWDFFSDEDPTHGFVKYLSSSNAQASGLARYSNGEVVLGVDSTNTYNANSSPGRADFGRPSVRISTQQSFYHGLFIMNVRHMPSGCGTWPALWLLGADGNWPFSGEFDIIEGVNNRQQSLSVMHTGYQCMIAGDSRTMTGALQSTDCYYDTATGQGAVGCAVLDRQSNTYGDGLNNAGGATYAVEWTSDAIKVWSFPAGSVPSDIGAGTPDPSLWGTPKSVFNGPRCDIDQVMGPQKIIINTDFCGDFGDAVWSSEGCAAQTGYSSCSQYVANNPAAFTNAYWQIPSIQYYARVAAVSTTSSTTTTTSSVTTVSDTTTLATVTTTTTDQPTIAPVTTTTTNIPTTSTTSCSSYGFLSVTTGTDGFPTTVYGDLCPSTTPVAVSTTTTTRNTVDPGTGPTTTINVGNTVGPIPTTTTTRGNTIGPVTTGAVSASTWASWTDPDSLTTGVVESSIFAPPMGGAVPITSGAFYGVGQWNDIPAVKTLPPTQPTNTWNEWSDSGKTITITKTWSEPCETGWAIKTTVVITTHCGCVETPVPKVPMKVITTECPEAWGFKTPVVVTVPDTAAITWSAWPADSTGKKDNGKDYVKDNRKNNAEVWATVTVPVIPTQKVPVVDAPAWSALPKEVVPASTWAVAPVSPTGSAPAAGQAWTDASKPVGKWTGGASKSSVGAGVIGFVVAVVAFLL